MSTDGPILVLGTGELGIEVIRSLALHNHRNSRHITVLLRPCSANHAAAAKRQLQLAEFEKLNVSTVEADVAEDGQPELEGIFARYHTIIGCSGMTYPPGTQLKIAGAVLAAEVRRYFPWQFGVDYDLIGRGSSQDLFSEQLDVRDLLRGQNKTDWIIISTGIFMSFLFEPAFGVVDADRRTVTALGAWDNEVTVTTVQDIGRVVAEIVYLAPSLKGVVYTAGATVSYEGVAQAVARFQSTQGIEVRRNLATVDQLKRELESDPNNGLKKYRVVFAEGKGVAWDEAKTYNSQRRMGLCGVDEWISKQL